MATKKKKAAPGKQIPPSVRIWEVEEVPMEYTPPEDEGKLGDLIRKVGEKNDD